MSKEMWVDKELARPGFFKPSVFFGYLEFARTKVEKSKYGPIVV